MQNKVLIVKLGYTETLDHRIISHTISLGDIFRTTAILHLFKDREVTWLTTEEGMPLLIDNPYIKRVLVYDITTAFQLQAEYFDIVINLEKIPGICALVDSLKARKKYGFRFNMATGDAEAYEHSYEVLANSDDPDLRRRMKKNWIEMLYNMAGKEWNGEGYILGYKPKTEEEFDIGFNTKVSSRWPNKAWPEKHWNELESLIGKRYSVSHQRSLNNIEGYIDWLNTCRLVITNDSLGLHLAIFLKKKIIAIFGPTSDKEVCLFDRGVVVRPPERLDCMPCFDTHCKDGKGCMSSIEPEVIYKNIGEILG